MTFAENLLTHFLKPKEIFSMKLPPRACVTVRVDARKKEVTVMPDAPGITKEGVEWSALPSAYTVRFEDETLPSPQPTGRFKVSLNTIGPYHLLTDYF